MIPGNHLAKLIIQSIFYNELCYVSRLRLVGYAAPHLPSDWSCRSCFAFAEPIFVSFFQIVFSARMMLAITYILDMLQLKGGDEASHSISLISLLGSCAANDLPAIYRLDPNDALQCVATIILPLLAMQWRYRLN